LKKRTKKLLSVGAGGAPRCLTLGTNSQKFFASFFQKRSPCFLPLDIMSHSISYPAALNEAAAKLAASGIEAPRYEARLLLAHVLGLRPRALPPSDAAVDRDVLGALVARRAAREPLAYITGTAGFWSFEVAVSPATLIPRADSETLIEAAVAAFPRRGVVGRVLDLGTGTGCLLLAALTEFAAAFGVGVDRVAAAASLAADNAARLGLDERARFVVGDWAAALAGRFDLVLCNPPYIGKAEIAGLMPEVALHEPVSALAAGGDGLAAYARLLPAMPALLTPGGIAIFELGRGQAEAVSELARRAGFAEVATRRDLGGIERALVLSGIT
jgi:release factor glutamine methyltransferase